MKTPGIQYAVLLVLLLLAACTSDSTISQARQTGPMSETSASAPKNAPPSSANLGIVSHGNAPRDPSPGISMPGFGKTEVEKNDASATKMDPLKVTESRLAGYTRVSRGGTLWLEHLDPRPEFNRLWIDPGYWGYEIVKIEGKEVATMSMKEANHLFFTLPEPMHLTIRSRSGRVQEVEAFTHVDP